VIGAGVVAYVIANGSSGGAASASGIPKVGVPQILSVAQVESFASRASGPIYWVGPGHPSTHLEVTTTSAGDVFVRYLTGSATAGDPRPAFTTIGTYGLANAYNIVRADGRAKGASEISVPNGGIATTSRKAPGSYYVAFPNSKFVTEVYDPSPANAHRLVISGQVTPIP
jgi:hypothetical protein